MKHIFQFFNEGAQVTAKPSANNKEQINMQINNLVQFSMTNGFILAVIKDNRYK